MVDNTDIGNELNAALRDLLAKDTGPLPHPSPEVPGPVLPEKLWDMLREAAPKVLEKALADGLIAPIRQREA